MVDDPRVVAGREAGGAGPPGEGEQLREAKAAVAADAWIRGLASGVAANEGSHDSPAKLVTKVKRHVRQAERVARFARRDHGLRRAAGALRVRGRRVDPEPQRHTDRSGPGAQQRDGAVDTAAHRHSDAISVRLGSKDLPERVRECVGSERLARHRGRLEQRQTCERALQADGVRVDDPVAVD